MKKNKTKWYYIIIHEISIAPLNADDPEYVRRDEGPYNHFFWSVLPHRYERLGILSSSVVNRKATFREEGTSDLCEFFDEDAFESLEKANQYVRKMNKRTRWEEIDRFLALEKKVNYRKPQFTDAEYVEIMQMIVGREMAREAKILDEQKKQFVEAQKKEKRWYRRFLRAISHAVDLGIGGGPITPLY